MQVHAVGIDLGKTTFHFVASRKLLFLGSLELKHEKAGASRPRPFHLQSTTDSLFVVAALSFLAKPMTMKQFN
jgi:hypothetical protein